MDTRRSRGPQWRGRGARGGRHHRGRPAREFERGRGRRRPHEEAVQNQQPEENVQEDLEDEVPDMFPRRKVESNWSRYEAAEQEEHGEEQPTRRGTDYHVLLGSAGSSFTQFRLAEEKDWLTESFSTSQMSVVSVDLQALAQSVQHLPLALRLNFEQELLQMSFPVELPTTSRKMKAEGAVIGQVRPGEKSQTDSPGYQLTAPASHNILHPGDNVPLQNSTKSMSLAEDLNEELDFLLASHTSEKNMNESQATDLSKGKMCVPDPAGDSKLQPFEDDQLKSDPGTRTEAAEEDLEDWLDSMIS